MSAPLRIAWVVSIGFLAGGVGAQSTHEWSDDLLATTDTTARPAARFWMPTDEDRKILVGVGYDNLDGQNTVSVTWHVRFEDTEPTQFDETESLSFRPHAVCAGAFESSRLFVAGWSERDAQLVLEQWDLVAPQVVGQTTHPVTGELLTTSTSPSLRRTELARLTEPGPLWSMTANPHAGGSGRLLLLEHLPVQAGVARVWEFDIEERALLDHDADEQPDPLWTATSHPTIQGRSNIWAAAIPELGFVVFFTDDLSWKPSFDVDEFGFAIDDDQDGDYEIVSQLPAEDFLDAYPYESWARSRDE